MIEIKYIDNSTQHNNLELKLGKCELRKVCDSYWYHELPALPNFTAKEVIILNLKNLKDCFKDTNLNKRYYLPFDLSDQSSGFVCFKSLSMSGIVNVYYVNSINKRGSEISPLFDPEFQLHFDDYFSIEGGFTTSKNSIISSLQVSIESMLKS